VNTTLLLLLVVVTLYPMLHVLFASFSEPRALAAHRGLLLRPLGFSVAAYRFVFDNPIIPIAYRNTLLYVILGTSLNMVMTSLGAYGLSRRGVLLRNPIMFMIVFTMFFSGGLVPTYLLVARTLGMLDTPWALIIPPAISTWNLIVLRTAFEAVPVELEEAARMDGANDITILCRVVLPLSVPALAVIALFYAVGHWNAWFGAMIYLRTRELFPLQLILREILLIGGVLEMMTGVSQVDQEPIGQTIQYATIIVATVPILCLYPFLQRYFVKGVMIGAIKG
jgi:putative aldouronate transport system permease protein